MKSYKHKDTRPHIPSQEEAGYETASSMVSEPETDYLRLPKNPVVHRGQDPELWWLNKYGNDNRDELLKLDIRSLYRHEHISPELIMQSLYRLQENKQPVQLSLNDLFGNALEVDEEEKVAGYYHHQDGWSNRLIQGDSLLTMASLLEREGMAGKVQTIYFDPPYGIKYGGNWQMKLNSRDVKDGADEHLSGEPEMIKAFRDTWADGIHSYLSYLRDRLLVAKELLTESGSCFVQISDENVHLVRNLMDEVFGSENFVSIITYQKSSPLLSKFLPSTSDFIIWYSKSIDLLKYRQLFVEKKPGDEGASRYTKGIDRDGNITNSANYKGNIDDLRLFTDSDLSAQTGSIKETFNVNYEGRVFSPSKGRLWQTHEEGMKRLIKLGRVFAQGSRLRYIRFFEDFPVNPIINIWTDIGGIQSRSDPKVYTVQTSTTAIQRCILMTTDPGDLVLDPTCGSGTTAFVAEQWGRRWITIDTSRIALNIAKTRLMTASFPYYHLYADSLVKREEKDGKIKKMVVTKAEHECTGDIRQGFVYEEVPHITLKSLANDEPADTETLYDKPYEDKGKLRVAGPFTVETLQSFNPVSPEELDAQYNHDENFEERIYDHLRSAGIMNGIRNERAVFKRIEKLNSEYLHARGFYDDAQGLEKTAYLHIGPKFGSVSKLAVSAAIKECRQRPDADWLVVLGFAFESNISNDSVTSSMGSFEVTKARMHDDLMQDGLLKKPKNVGSFVTIGEPDVVLKSTGNGNEMVAEILGLDIYDPIKDEVKPRDIHDIAYWMVDDDYDGSSFVVKQVFFCGGDKDEFDKWKKGLGNLSESRNKRKQQAQQTLRIEIDDEAFDRLYGHSSHPIPYRKGRQVAVRVISQFGEESTKILTM
ncbi:MAG: site-specific DNA-methyltransferase [Sphingobacteriaceae bacterium]|nr:site-specific DNA-methyltransferase [Sphingobacteriaceae bacterium]